jgi:hypothetical protein
VSGVVIAALVLGSGVGSLLLGQDANTDLYRYHFYIGYAFVHGRLDYDLLPAGLGTFLNPVLDAIHYLGIAHLPPRAFGFLLGALQGLNPVLVFLLARRLLEEERGSTVLAVFAAVLAATGPTAISLLGTTMGDTIASIPALLSLLLVLGDPAPFRDSRSAFRLLAAGVFGGVALALKLTTGPHAVALAVVVLTLARRPAALRAVGTLLVGNAVGFLLVGGRWCGQLWERFGNPLFPYANSLFRSPYLPVHALRDSRWEAQGPLDLLATPFTMAWGDTSRLQEIPFHDSRFLVVFLLALVWVGLRLSGRGTALPPGQRGLLVYLLVAYLTWVAVFDYYRYAAVLEYLAPLGFVVLWQAVRPRFGRPLLFVTGAFLILSSSVGSWQRHPWWDRWWRVTLPAQAYEPNTLVLLTSPLNSFLAPFFPERTRFVGLEWVGSSRLDDLVVATVGSHKGTLMVLAGTDEWLTAESLRRYGLTVTNDCGVIRTGAGKKLLCRALRSIGAERHP